MPTKQAVVQPCTWYKNAVQGNPNSLRLLVREQGLPAGFSAHIFQRVHATPLCALFADAGAPGFAGHCDASLMLTACSNPERWCAGDGGANVGPLVVGELVAAQVGALNLL